MTFLKQLRDAAAQCSKIEYRSLLRDSADELEGRIRVLHANPTTEAMQQLNAAWSKAARVLKEVPPEADPAPLGGHTEPARLAA